MLTDITLARYTREGIETIDQVLERIRQPANESAHRAENWFASI